MAVAANITENNRSPEEIQALKNTVVSRMKQIVGDRWVSADPIVLDSYTRQYVAELVTGTNYMERPIAVVLPKNTEDVSRIVKACNEAGCQYKAISTGFGAWGAASCPENVVQIDLRRMDRIIKIDRDNMYAVVEPYVTGNELQTETMKVGLNCHMAGVGSGGSVLASQTAMMGQSWDGISMGFSARNLLGVEWVTPDGRIVQLGSFDATGEYFSGDGPGLSLRGIMRGFAGTMGGLGVFTKCAVKLYPWYGPEKLEIDGVSPYYYTRIPENHEAGFIVVNSWDQMAELGYRLCDAEIVDILGRNAPALLTAVMTMDNNEFLNVFQNPFFKAMTYNMAFAIFARDKEDYKYRIKTLKSIVKSVGGGLVLSGFTPQKMYWMLQTTKCIAKETGWKNVMKSLPGISRLMKTFVKNHGLKGLDYLTAMMYEALVRQGMQLRGVFRFGGTFHTAMGSLFSWDNAIQGAKIGEQVKQKYINDGVIFDDGGDNAWGGFYESGAFSHLEELACYDPRDPYCLEHANDYCIDCNMACIDYHLGDCINGIGPANHVVYSPACYDYDKWQQKIKAALDPNLSADASFYTIPGYEKNPPERVVKSIERVRANRAKVQLID